MFKVRFKCVHALSPSQILCGPWTNTVLAVTLSFQFHTDERHGDDNIKTASK